MRTSARALLRMRGPSDFIQQRVDEDEQQKRRREKDTQWPKDGGAQGWENLAESESMVTAYPLTK